MKSVIFSLDGTLIDSPRAHALAWKSVLDEKGIRNSLDEIHRFVGMKNELLIPRLAGVEENSNKGREVLVRKEEIFKMEHLSQVQCFPGCKELLMKLRSQGFRLMGVSVIQKVDLIEVLDRLQIRQWVETPITSPEGFKGLMDKYGIYPSETTLLAASPYDIEMGQSLGIRIAAVKSAGWSDAQLVGASVIYRDIADILENFESSPFASSAIPEAA